MGQQVADTVCGIWENNAGFLTSFPDPTGIGAFNTGVLDSLCRPRNRNPPPPIPPFQGGQCAIDYTVSVTFGSSNGGPNDQPQTIPVNGSTVYLGVRGPIGGTFFRGNPGGDGYQGGFLVPPQSGALDGFFVVWTSSTPDYDQYDGAFTAITGVVPSSGGPDVCGDPPPAFPFFLPPIGIFNIPFNLNVGPLSLPVRFIFNRFNFRPQFNFNPQLVFEVGPFNFNFDLGGLQIGFNPNFNFPEQPNPPALPPGSPDGGGSPDNVKPPTREDQEEIKDELDDIKECACDEPPDPPDILSAGFSGAGGVVTVGGKILYVTMTITELGEGVRSQLGSGGAPDVFYLGWHSFGFSNSGNPGDRVPISFLSSTFLPPTESCGTFSWSLNFNSECAGTVFYVVED